MQKINFQTGDLLVIKPDEKYRITPLVGIIISTYENNFVVNWIGKDYLCYPYDYDNLISFIETKQMIYYLCKK